MDLIIEIHMTPAATIAAAALLIIAVALIHLNRARRKNTSTRNN